MIGEVAGIYLKIILEFLLELYVFYVLAMFCFRRSHLFALKLAGGLVFMAALGFGASFVYYYFGDTSFGRIAIYLVLFAASTGHACLCFAEDKKTVLFGCSVAYAAQNLAYKLFLIFFCACEQLRLFDSWGQNFSIFYRIIYYIFLIAAGAAIYFLVIRRIMSRLGDSAIALRMLAISVVVLLVTVILCSVEDVHFAALSSGRENRFDSFDIYALRQAGNVFSVVCCIIVLLLIAKTLVERHLRREVDYLQYAIRQGEKQYEISKDTIDMINIKCHDIKYKVNSLVNRGGDMPTELIDDLNKSISIYDTRVETGNKILDVILTEKSLYCEQNGITFSCMADGQKLSFISDGDLYCLFGNIIDNALEAVNKVPEKERRVINIVVKEKNGTLVVQEENYFEGELDFVDGLPQTTKGDTAYHGFGTRSIRMIVSKYGGVFTARAQDGVFYLNIIFCLNKDNSLQNK